METQINKKVLLVLIVTVTVAAIATVLAILSHQEVNKLQSQINTTAQNIKAQEPYMTNNKTLYEKYKDDMGYIIYIKNPSYKETDPTATINKVTLSDMKVQEIKKVQDYGMSLTYYSIPKNSTISGYSRYWAFVWTDTASKNHVTIWDQDKELFTKDLNSYSCTNISGVVIDEKSESVFIPDGKTIIQYTLTGEKKSTIDLSKDKRAFELKKYTENTGLIAESVTNPQEIQSCFSSNGDKSVAISLSGTVKEISNSFTRITEYEDYSVVATQHDGEKTTYNTNLIWKNRIDGKRDSGFNYLLNVKVAELQSDMPTNYIQDQFTIDFPCTTDQEYQYCKMIFQGK